MTKFLFGALPPIPGRPVMMLQPHPAPAALPPLPPEVHNLELVPDPDMLGNDVWGDCVFAAIENDRRVSAAALGVPITRLTAKQVIANYCAYTGVHTAPGPGAVIQLALEWAQKNGWGGNHLLCFARVSHTGTPVRETVNEFQSGVFGVEIDASEESPATIWNADNSAYMGGHGVAGGSYTPTYIDVKTWGYIAQMTGTYLSKKVSEFYILVWDFMWESLTYERQVQLVTDYCAITQNVWTGPKPEVKVVPFTDQGPDVKTASSNDCWINTDGSLGHMFVVQTVRKGVLGGRHAGKAHTFVKPDGTVGYILDSNFQFSK